MSKSKLGGSLAKTTTLEPTRSYSRNPYFNSRTWRQSSNLGPRLIVDFRVEKGPARGVLVQVGAGVAAGFDARTAKLFSFWAFSLSICSLAALVTRGFLTGAFAPSLGVAAALVAPLAAPPRPLPVPRPRFGRPSALRKVNTRCMDCQEVWYVPLDLRFLSRRN